MAKTAVSARGGVDFHRGARGSGCSTGYRPEGPPDSDAGNLGKSNALSDLWQASLDRLEVCQLG